MLDLSAAFDTIDHKILLQLLSDKYGFTDKALSWFRSYLCDRTQAVTINGITSNSIQLKYGVPQGSVLGPILFSLYLQPLSDILSKLNVLYNYFADDSQMQDSCKPSNVSNMVVKMSDCVKSVGGWMKDNKLKINDDKTDVICVGSKHNVQNIDTKYIDINNNRIQFSDCVKNLGVYLDSSLSMEQHINNLCKTLFFHLRRISKIRNFLTINAANKLVVSFILSRLDYCNSVLAGLSDKKMSKLQRIQNCAARMVLKKSRKDNATALLRSLHWLPVKARIEYKICSICYQILHSKTSPSYLKNSIKIYKPPRLLRTQHLNLLVVPRYKLNNYGKRSFSILGPKLWNSLPFSARVSPNICNFKTALKTHLFKKFLPLS